MIGSTSWVLSVTRPSRCSRIASTPDMSSRHGLRVFVAFGDFFLAIGTTFQNPYLAPAVALLHCPCRECAPLDRSQVRRSVVVGDPNGVYALLSLGSAHASRPRSLYLVSCPDTGRRSARQRCQPRPAGLPRQRPRHFTPWHRVPPLQQLLRNKAGANPPGVRAVAHERGTPRSRRPARRQALP